MLLLVRHVLSLMQILLHFVGNTDAMINVVVVSDVAVHVAYVVAVHVAYAVNPLKFTRPACNALSLVGLCTSV